MHSSTQFGLKAWSAWSSSLRTQEEWLEWARNPFTPNGEDKPKKKGYKCEYCEEIAKTPKGLRSHCTKKHGIDIDTCSESSEN